jgi:hypothetical protein
MEATNIQSITPPPVDGDHSVVTGIMSMLACYLADGASTLKVLDATNKIQLAVTSQLDLLGSQESAEIDRLSGNSDGGNPGNWHDNEGSNALLPDAPGLQWLLSNAKNCWGDESTVIIEGVQSHISDVQLDFTNKTSTVQQKVDVNKDSAQDIESEFNSLLQSVMAGLVSILQTGNSARV